MLRGHSVAMGDTVPLRGTRFPPRRMPRMAWQVGDFVLPEALTSQISSSEPLPECTARPSVCACAKGGRNVRNVRNVCPCERAFLLACERAFLRACVRACVCAGRA